MSEHIYEAKTLNAWHEYVALGGKVSFEAFLERDIKVNLYVINLLKKFSGFDELSLFAGNYYSDDDYADSYANPKGGI
jgi:hypothetical protein